MAPKERGTDREVRTGLFHCQRVEVGQAPLEEVCLRKVEAGLASPQNARYPEPREPKVVHYREAAGHILAQALSRELLRAQRNETGVVKRRVVGWTSLLSTAP